MKIELTRRIQTAATIAALILGFASMARAGDQKNAPNPPPAVATAGSVDPVTGLPVSQWIDPDWKDSGLALQSFSFQDLPLSELAKVLKTQFKEAFDVILPGSCDFPSPNGQSSPSRIEIGNVTVKLDLKNVRATDVFNAMNLVFESENAPLRWELKMNGKRPLALLRVEPSLLPPPAPDPPPPTGEKKRMVYFVGDLVGDGKTGGMTMQQLFDTVSSVYNMAFNEAAPGANAFGVPAAPPANLKFHDAAQLLVVEGTYDKIDFVQNTLAALREKKQRLARQAALDSKSKSEAPPTPEAAPSPNK
jgi:hypothetical protein